MVAYNINGSGGMHTESGAMACREGSSDCGDIMRMARWRRYQRQEKHILAATVLFSVL